jgi:hypothetical protein
MQCPKCQKEDFEKDKPCPQCGFQGDSNMLDELGHLQWLLSQMDEWEKFNIDTATVSNLKKIFTAQRKDILVALGLRLPSFTPEEAKKAWVELTHLETLFEKVDEWRDAGYFNEEMKSLDPVKRQRALADELRQRLEEYPRIELPQTDQDRLITVNFLLDNIDLLASRQWFKSKKEIEMVIAPIMTMMVDVISEDESE